MQKKFILVILGSALLATAAGSGCALRQKLKDHKQAEQDAASERSAEKSREITKTFEQQDAELAQKEFEIRRRYLYALEGDYVGMFNAVPSTDTNSANTKITLHVEVQHDVNPKTIQLDLTASEIRSKTESMTLQFEVTEFFPAVGGGSEMPMNCVQDDLKPDLKKGLIRFVCPGTSSVPGRDYQFSLDDLSNNPKDARTFTNILPRSISTNDRLIDGAIDAVRNLNLKIMTPFGKQFFGTLDR